MVELHSGGSVSRDGSRERVPVVAQALGAFLAAGSRSGRGSCSTDSLISG